MRRPYWFALCLGLAFPAAMAVAEVKLPAIFSEHAVLQRSARVPVWGKADAGREITISLGKTVAKAVADDKGRWQAMLDLSQSAAGPFDLIVQGENTVTIPDVVVGEVWIASGQSNMEWTLANTPEASKELTAPSNPALRLFLVTKAEAAIPIKGYQGKWVVAGPDTIANFSAVGYYFGKFLQEGIKAPVGMIQSAWGGTPIETWTSKEALVTDPEIAAGVEKREEDLRTYSRRLREYLLAMSDWQDANQRQNQPAEAVPEDGDWQPVTLPGKIGDAGAVWLRRTVDITSEQATRPLLISINEGTTGIEQVFWNGKPIGSSSLEQVTKSRAARRYTVPTSALAPGESVLAIRFTHPASDLSVSSIVVGKPMIPGTWMRKIEQQYPALSAESRAALPAAPGVEPLSWQAPSHLFNAMIYPLIPYAIQGVVWYQGENNIERAWQYRKALPLMIADWRSRWGQGDFAFYICQLANKNDKPAAPGDSNWAELRESQSATLSVPNTGEAVLIDLGDSVNIHPRNKKDVGARLSALALAGTYGQKIVGSGPVYQSMKVDGDKIRLTFTGAGTGLVAKPLPETYSVDSETGAKAPTVRNSSSELEGFAICGEDRKWTWANAKIEGGEVVVSSPQVPSPVAVRYAWSSNPTCNLYNAEGFPASPFRTDDFPLSTQAARY